MKRFITAIIIMGFSGIVAQILLLRELLITFFGNELSIGIILANWLILEATGSFFVGKKIEKLNNKIEAYVIVTLLFSIFFPIAIYLARTWKEIIGIALGEGLGLLPMLYSSFFILLPVSLLHGALFTFGCKIFSLHAKQEATSIGKVYIYETLGTIAGGIAFTYLLITYFHSLQIALGVALLNIAISVYLLSPQWLTRQALIEKCKDSEAKNIGSIPNGNWRLQSVASKILAGVSVTLLVLCAYFLFSPKANESHRHSIKKQWQSQNIIHYQNSIYGNVAVTQSGEQYTFFSDGVPIITTPTPDIVFMEEFVHLPMLFHPDPEHVLIISGGAGGVINEILKHPIKRMDYVELDPLILEIVQEFSTPLTETEFTDPRVNIHYMDGRFYIKKTSHIYDVVLVGLSNPQDLQTNRLFTKEFFSLVAHRLKKGGILAISLPGSLTYLGKELKNLNGCIRNTLKEVYPYLRIIPGDGTNLFLASMSQNLAGIDEVQLSQRLKERNLQVNLLTSAHIEYKLHPRWLNWFLKSVQGSTEKINQDFMPSGVFYSLSYWNALFSPYMQKIFGYVEKVNIKLIIFLLGILILFFILFHFRIRDLSRLSIPFAIATTGFAGMIFDLALIFTFQALYGFIFYWIGLLTTAFMVGVAVGSLVMTYLLAKIEKDITWFLRIEVGIIIFSGLLPLIFLLFSPYLERAAIFVLMQIVFLVVSCFSGVLIGAEFPLANKICLSSPLSGKNQTNFSTTAGLLYGCDLFGGWISGIIGGVVLLPVLGLLKTCMVVVMLKISSLIIIATSVRRRAGIR